MNIKTRIKRNSKGSKVTESRKIRKFFERTDRSGPERAWLTKEPVIHAFDYTFR